MILTPTKPLRVNYISQLHASSVVEYQQTLYDQILRSAQKEKLNNKIMAKKKIIRLTESIHCMRDIYDGKRAILCIVGEITKRCP